MPTHHQVLLHCNAGSGFGMGHLMRCLALAEEAAASFRVTIAGDLDPRSQELAAALVPTAEVVPVALADLPAWLRTASAAPELDLVHLDTYWLDEADIPGGVLVSNMQDGAFGARPADLVIDANLGAERRIEATTPATAYALGIDAAPLRRQVRSRRRTGPVVATDGLRVLVVIGGTDPERLTSVITEALTRSEASAITVVGPPEQRARLDALAAADPRITVVAFVADLPGTAAEHDLVVSAAGTSIWDFACIGVPMALVCVVDNQRPGYRAALDAGIAVGLGEPPHSDLGARVTQAVAALGTPARAALATAGQTLVDGLGAWRIVAAWRQLLVVPVADRVGDRGLVARPATPDDADLLLAWRNDPATRQASRTSTEVTRDEHLAWFGAVLERVDRRLLVVESADGAPVGTVRWDQQDHAAWEVSITLAPECRGAGLAAPVLEAGERHLAAALDGPVRMLAGVHDDNAASRRLFARAGYLPHRPADEAGFATYARWHLRSRPR